MGHRKGFSDNSETEPHGDVTNGSFPHPRYKPSRSEAYFDRESGRYIADREQSDKLSDSAKC